jgi:hypothetical protein
MLAKPLSPLVPPVVALNSPKQPRGRKEKGNTVATLGLRSRSGKGVLPSRSQYASPTENAKRLVFPPEGPSLNLALFIKECRYYQDTVGLLFGRLPFTRLVREIQGDITSNDILWKGSALYTLQYAAEDALTMQMSMLYSISHVG